MDRQDRESSKLLFLGGMGDVPTVLASKGTSPVEVAYREFYLQDLVFYAKGSGRAIGSVEAELTILLLRFFQARMG